METIVVLDPIAPATADRMRALLPDGMTLTHGTDRDEAHLRAIIEHADYAVSGQIAVPGTVLRAAKRLKLLHKWGVGVDNLDLDTARELGIPVARTTGSNALAVAEFALALTLAALRHLAHSHAELTAGHWRVGAIGIPARTLTGKTVGIIGFGATGQAFARLLAGFQTKTLYYKRTRLDPATEAALNATHTPVPELLAQSDVVSLHCPLTKETAGLIDAAALATMKPTAILTNVARGGVVIEEDLIAALAAGTIAAAAFDVYETEPLSPNSPLIGLPNLITTPHIAAQSADAFEPTIRQMFGNIERIARGEPIPDRDLVV